MPLMLLMIILMLRLIIFDIVSMLLFMPAIIFSRYAFDAADDYFRYFRHFRFRC